MLTLGVLGPLWAADEQGPLVLKGPRHRAVLARLLVARGRVVPVERLVDDLWEKPPRNAVGAIHTFVSALRRSLEPGRAPRRPSGLLITSPPGYVLRVAAEQVDAGRFEILFGEASALLVQGRDTDALGLLDTALALWQGPAYAEFTAQGWARAEIARLEELRVLAIERRAEALVALGRYAEAAGVLQAQSRAYPLRESLWRAAALALYRAGRQADALAALRTVRRTLRSELGVDPGPELRALEADLLAQAPHLMPVTDRAPAPVREPPRRAGPDPFVGRADQLALLDRSAQDVRDRGGATVVLVSGVEGVGKTALAERFSAHLGRCGWTTAWGPSPAGAGVPPNWAWTRIVETLTAAGHRMPVLAPDNGGDAVLARFLARQAAVAYATEVAAAAPVVVVFDDLHWAGEETLDLLSALATAPVGGPALLIGLYRDTDMGAALTATLARIARAEPVRIALSGLTEAETGELVRDLTASDIEAAAVRRIHQRGSGNPFFTRELAHLLNEEGEAAFDAVPPGVRDVVRHRFGRLTEAEQVVLQQASVFGVEVDLGPLVELAGATDPVLTAVDAALRAGFLCESGSAGVAFAHAVVRDVVYSDIGGPRRALWHGEAGAILERAGRSDPAILAHHFARAATRAAAARAARYARTAALAAEQGFAPHDAARLWAEAAAACERDGDVPGRLDAAMGLARALAVTGRLEQARHRRAEAIEAAEAFGDRELTARVLVAFDVPAVWTDNDDPELARRIAALAERLLSELPGAGAELRCRLLTTIALELRATDGERGRAAGAQAEAIAGKLADPALTALTLDARFMQSFHRAGLAAERARIGTELITLSRTHRLITFEVLGHLIAIQALSATREFDSADRHAAAADALAERYGLPLIAVFTHWYRALRRSVSAPYAEAEAAYRTAAAALPGSAMPGLERGLLPLALLCLCLRHDRPIDADPDTDWGSHQPWVRPLVLLDGGRREQARDALRALPDPPPDLLLELRLCLIARAAVELGEHELMARVRDRLLPAAGELAGAGTGLVTLEPVTEYLDRLTAALDRSR